MGICSQEYCDVVQERSLPKTFPVRARCCIKYHFLVGGFLLSETYQLKL